MRDYELKVAFPGLDAVYDSQSGELLGVVIPSRVQGSKYGFVFFCYETGTLHYGPTSALAVEAYLSVSDKDG